MPAVRRLLSSVGLVTGVTLGSLASYLLAVLVAGRSMPRESFGYFTLWTYALNVLGAAALLGMNNAVLRRHPRADLAERRWPRVLPGMTAVAAGVSVIGAWVFAAVYHAPFRDAALLAVAGTGIGGGLLSVTLLQIFGRFATAQALNTLWRPILLAGIGAAWALGVPLSPPRLFALIAAGGAIQIVIAAFTVRGLPRGDTPLSVRALVPDAAVFAALLVTGMMLFRLDSFFLPKILDLDRLGLYSALGFLTLTGYSVVTIALTQVLGPKLASREAVPIRLLTAGILAGGLAAGFVLTFAANRLVPLVFSGAYAGDHRPVVALLSGVGVLQVLYAIPSSRVGILAGQRVLRAYVAVSLSAVAVEAVLLPLLVPRWGLTGAAAATLVTWTWRTGTGWAVARRYAKLSVALASAKGR